MSVSANVAFYFLISTRIRCILSRMRRFRFFIHGHRILKRRLQLASVEYDVALAIAVDEISRRQDVEHARPAMRMERLGFSGRNRDIEHSDLVVL